MSGPGTSELEVRAGLGSAEFTLVRAVATVVLRVALPVSGNTAIVVTGELTGRAGDVRTTSFVAVVAAIVLRVATEAQGDTASSLTLEFVAAAGGLCAVLHLVAVVETIVVAVADPGLGHATLVGAREVPSVRAGEKWGLGLAVLYTRFAYETQ